LQLDKTGSAGFGQLLALPATESGQGKFLLAAKIGGTQAAFIKPTEDGAPLFGAAAVEFSFGRGGCLHGWLLGVV
jgi:hypothetical protein